MAKKQSFSEWYDDYNSGAYKSSAPKKSTTETASTEERTYTGRKYNNYSSSRDTGRSSSAKSSFSDWYDDYEAETTARQKQAKVRGAQQKTYDLVNQWGYLLQNYSGGDTSKIMQQGKNLRDYINGQRTVLGEQSYSDLAKYLDEGLNWMDNYGPTAAQRTRKAVEDNARFNAPSAVAGNPYLSDLTVGAYQNAVKNQSELAMSMLPYSNPGLDKVKALYDQNKKNGRADAAYQTYMAAASSTPNYSEGLIKIAGDVNKASDLSSMEDLFDVIKGQLTIQLQQMQANEDNTMWLTSSRANAARKAKEDRDAVEKALAKIDEYIERKNYLGQLNPLRNNEDWEEKSKYVPGAYDETYDVINGNREALESAMPSSIPTNAFVAGMPASARSSYNYGKSAYEAESFSQVTKDEAAMYNYLMATDPEKAQQYLEYLRPIMRARESEKNLREMRGLAEDYPVLASGLSVLGNMYKGLGLPETLADYFINGKVDENSYLSTVTQVPSQLRGAVAEKVAERHPVGSKVYEQFMSAVDNFAMVASTMGFGAGMGAVSEGIVLGLMSTGAAQETIIANKKAGMDDTRAVILGALSGLIEYGTEKIGLDALFNGAFRGASIGKDLVRSMLAEGGEEVLSDVFNLTAEEVYDAITSQDMSTWKQLISQYQAEHPDASESEAFGFALAQVLKDMGADFAGGAFAGGLLGGGMAGANAISDFRTSRGISDYAGDALEGVIDFGLHTEEHSAAYKGAEKLQAKVDAGEEIYDTEIMQQYRRNLYAERAGAAEEEEAPSSANSRGAEGTNAGQTEVSLSARNVPVKSESAPLMNAYQQVLKNTNDQAVEMVERQYGTNGRAVFSDVVQNAAVQGVEPAQAGKAFFDAYSAGYNGFTKEVNALGETAYDAAYQAGKADYSERIQKFEQAKEGVSVYGKDSGLVINKYVAESLTGRQRRTVNQFGHALGRRFLLTDAINGGTKYGANTSQMTFIERGGRRTATDDTVMFTIGHEMAGHVVQSLAPTEYAAFQKLAARDRAEELQARMAAGQSYDMALIETAADYAGELLEKGAVLEQFIKEHGKSAEGRNFLIRFRDAIRNLLRKISGNPAYADLEKALTEAERALVDAMEAASVQAKANEKSNGAAAVDAQTEAEYMMGVMFDEETDSYAPNAVNAAFSEKTWRKSDYVTARKEVIDEMASKLGISKKKARAYIDTINGIAKMIADDRTRLDYTAAKGLSSFVGNVEYGGSFDFTTMCRKARLFMGTFSEVQKQLGNNALTADEVLKLRDLMKKKGYEVTCGCCYVEGSRANEGRLALKFQELYGAYFPDNWQPNLADLITPEGLEWTRNEHQECYEQYTKFLNNHGRLRESDPNLFASQQKPKMYQARTAYDGEILTQFRSSGSIDQKNRNGGIRMQSFSDFEIVHLIDNMQVIMDMARVGLAGQAYTKVYDFAAVFGGTGLKINLSLIAGGVDANGNLILDETEGMKKADAEKLRNMYPKNVGTIVVCFNDAEVMAAMKDPFIDFIIPFHRSQWKKSQYALLGLPAKVKDYTYQQNEKLIVPTYHEYRGKMVKDKASNYMPNEYWDFSLSGKENAEKYLRMCAENNKRPKFYKFLDRNSDGSYSLKEDGTTDGYWKLLIDFKMYDNKGNRSPQMPVRPDFNMEEAKRILTMYEGGHAALPVARDAADEFVSMYRKEHPKAQFSGKGDHTFRLSTATDQAYLDAVNSGDMETAQKMVDEAAKRAGYTSPKLYHGTNAFGFTEVDVKKSGDKISFFATDSIETAGTYSGTNNARNINTAASSESSLGMYQLYAKLDGMLTLDAEGGESNRIKLGQIERDYNDYFMTKSWSTHSTARQIAKFAKANGYPGIIIRNVIDTATPESRRTASASNVYIFFNPRAQVKSADPVTYDDAGNVIPLSERFNSENPDIRFSDKNDKAYRLAVDKGDMETAQKMVDKSAIEAGYDSPELFHGTKNFGFTEFDLGKMDDKISIFTTTDQYVAQTYVGQKGQVRDIADAFRGDINSLSADELVKVYNKNFQEKIYALSSNEREDLMLEIREDLRSASDTVMGIKDDNPYAFDETSGAEIDRLAGMLREMSEASDLDEFVDAYNEFYAARSNVYDRGGTIADQIMDSNVSRIALSAMDQMPVLIGNSENLYGFDNYKGSDLAEYMTDRQIRDAVRELSGGIYKMRGKTSNMLTISGGWSNWNNIDLGRETERFNDWWVNEKGHEPSMNGYYRQADTRSIAEYAKAKGYDGIIITDVYDSGGYTEYDEPSDLYVYFNSSSLKSTDPVTYDENGDVIPLSERFNPENKDIRFSGKEDKKFRRYGNSDNLLVDEKGRVVYNKGGRSSDIQDLIDRLNEGQVPIEAVMDHPIIHEIIELNRGTPTIELPNREGIRKAAYEKAMQRGSFDGKGYRGEIRQEHRMDIVIGLPGSGKSSVYTEPLSQKYGSRVIDTDDFRDYIPGYDGLNAGLVHEEASAIRDSVLEEALLNGDNILLSTIGANSNKLRDKIDTYFRNYGYDVYLHLNELPNNKAIARALGRFFKEDGTLGRFVSPKLIYEYGNSPTQVYLEITRGRDNYDEGENRDGSVRGSIRTGRGERNGDVAQYPELAGLQKEILRGYDWYSNDVAFGERARLIESSDPDADYSNKSDRAIRQAAELVRQNRTMAEAFSSPTAEWRKDLTQLDAVKLNKGSRALVEMFGNDLDDSGTRRVVNNIRKLAQDIIDNKNMKYGEVKERAEAIASDIVFRDKQSKELMQYSPDAAYTIEQVGNGILANIISTNTKAGAQNIRALDEQIRKNERLKEQLKEVRRKRDEKIEQIRQEHRETEARKRERRKDSALRTRLLETMRRLSRIKTTDEFRKQIDSYIADFDLTAKGLTNNKRAQLVDLKKWIEEMQKADPTFRPSDQAVKAINRLDEKNIKGMEIEDARELLYALLNLENEIRTHDELLDAGYASGIGAAGRQIIEMMKDVRGTADHGILYKIYSGAIVDSVVRPETQILRMCGWNKDNPLYQSMFGDDGSLASGQRKMVDYQRRANQIFGRFLTDNRFLNSIDGKDARACTVSGLDEENNPVTLKVTPNYLMALWMHAQNEQNRKHFVNYKTNVGQTTIETEHKAGGITVPDFDLVRKGRTADAYDGHNSTKITMTPAGLNAAISQLKPKELEFCRAAQMYYSQMSQVEINEVSEQLLGYSLAKVDNYFRIVTDSDYRALTLDEIKVDGTIEGQGWTKERVSASNPIMLISLTEQLTKDVDGHSKYVGLAIPVRNVNRILSVGARTFNADGTVETSYADSVQNAIKTTWNRGGNEYIKKLMSDIQFAQKKVDDNWYSQIFTKFRSHYAATVLTLNAGVALKQAASYSTAAAVIGWRPLMWGIRAAGNGKVTQAQLDLISKYSPLMYLRTQGLGYQELADIRKLNNNALQKALNTKWLNWIQDIDVLTVKKLWKAAEYYVRENFTDLKAGSEEYYKKVGEIHSEIIEKTQPNYTALQRGEVLRTDNEFIRLTVGMFKTQPYQNFSILYDAFGNWHAKAVAHKVNANAQTKAELDAAVKQVARATSSQAVSALTFAMMQIVWNLFRRKDEDKLKDEDGNFSASKSAKELAIMMGSGIFGMIPLGSTLYEALETLVDKIARANGEETVFDAYYYGIDASTATEPLNNIFKAVLSLPDIVVKWKGKDYEGSVRKAIDNLSKIVDAAGYPMSNFLADIKTLAKQAMRPFVSKQEADYYAEWITNGVTSSNKKQMIGILFDAYTKDKEAYDRLYEHASRQEAFATSKKTAAEYIKEQMEKLQEEKELTDARKEAVSDELYAVYEENLANVYDGEGTYTQPEVYQALMETALKMEQQEAIWDQYGWSTSWEKYLEKQQKEGNTTNR